MVFAGGRFDLVADALDVGVGHEGIATIENHVEHRGGAICFYDVVLDFD